MKPDHLLEQDVANVCYEAHRSLQTVACGHPLGPWASAPDWLFARYCQAVAKRRQNLDGPLTDEERTLYERRYLPHLAGPITAAGEIFIAICRALLPHCAPLADQTDHPSRNSESKP